MTDANHERVNEFLRSLEKALGGPGRRSEGILGEVRADLEAHVKRYQAEGRSEDEAVERALDEMGNPYEMAHHMRQEIPPFGSESLATIRYVAASGVILWTLLMLWHFRGGSYGLSGPLVSGAVVLMHLPVILLIWPRIVWKKNWLFGLIPAGLALLFFVYLNMAGTETSTSIAIQIPETEAEVAALKQRAEEGVLEPDETGSSQIMRVLIFAGLGMVTVVLLVSMQQRSQRRVALLVMLLAAAIVEVPYQVEELLFRHDRKRARDYMETFFGESGAYPTKEAFKSNEPKLINRSARISFDAGREGHGYWIFWDRPLRPGFAIHYSSEDGSIRIQD